MQLKTPPDQIRGRGIDQQLRGSARRQHHDDLAAFESRILLDLGELGDVGLDLVQELGADLLVRHFAAAVAQGDLDLVAFLEEPLHRAHLHVVIVIVDHRTQLDLLDLDDLLLLARLGGFLLCRILELPVVHNLANGRIVVRRNLDEIHARLKRHLDGHHGLDCSVVEAGLIDQTGLNHGTVETVVAIKMALEAGMDLVEISPNNNPPVCKIMDYGKFKYSAQKKAAEARKKQKVVEIKEIKLRPMIDDHDYDVKMRAMQRFFEEGDKVKVTLRYRGREMAHQEIGTKLLDKVKNDVAEIAKVEQDARFEGRQVVMVLAPR